MYKYSFRVCLFVILLMSPWALYAAGLGKLVLNSALGQPLRAEIDLVSVNNNEIPSLHASLASQDAFGQAGISYVPFFSTFKISIESRANGDPYVKIISQQAVNEPFLNMLVELSWSSGRLLREYTVLLDPVDSSIPEPVAPTFRTVESAPAPIEYQSEESVEYVEQPIESAPVSEPIFVDQSGDTYGPVNRGDTLSNIARQVMPYGSDLNQMLVALYRANRDAFIEDNMNLLKVGVILQIPNSNEVAAIDEAEAKAEIKLQVADWHGYRDRLAAAATGAQTYETRRQTDAGHITTTVGNETVAVDVSPKEVLRLSSGEESSADVQGDDALLNRLRMMEEDSIARNLALEEANARVAMLEKNIENLQQLLELKDPTLAKAQVQAEALTETEVIPDIEVIPDDTDIAVTTLPSEPVSDSLVDSTIEQESVTIPDLSSTETLEEAVVDPLPLPEPEPETASFMDQIMDNIEYIGGALVVIFLGILALFIKRRKESEDFDDMDLDDLSSPESHEMETAAADILQTNEAESPYDDDGSVDDKLDDDSEKDTDFFPGENEEALEASTSVDEPDDTGNLPQDLSDESSDEIELDLDDLDDEVTNSTQNNEPDPDIAEDWMENPPEPNNEIEFDLGDSDAVQAEAEQADETEPEPTADEVPLVADPELSAAEITEDGASLDTVDLSDDSEISNESENEEDYEFEIDSADEVTNAKSSESEVAVDTDNVDVNADELSEMISLPEENETSDENKALNSDVESATDTDSFTSDDTQIPSLDLDEIDLNMDDSPSESSAETTDTVEESSNAVADPGEKDANWHEVATKIDLAKAYQELDDKEGAREILEEVVRDGDTEQKNAAKSMLESL